ncbi:MAG TPA: glycoside hydrolase family 2 protein [Candidatus Sulfopaludibacter sp.]|nr:glycoside hydrolase family 2 protein [Candidatus Sulfopaludibacter sp.]
MERRINKRQFLTTTITATAAALAWEPLVSLCHADAAPVLRRLSISGDWQVSQAGQNDWIHAKVPGCIHTDLLAAGKIPDPFYRENEKAVQWVGQCGWLYRRKFGVPEEVLKNDRVLLRCEGLDTLATIKINGREVGRADNMFRLWEFDVKSVLRAGENAIEISFESPFAYIKRRESDQAPAKWIKGRAWVRKEPCSFGWDWGPDLPGCGIWKNISLETFSQGRIADVLIRQNHSEKKVALDIEATVEVVRETSRPFKIGLSVLDHGKSIATTTIEVSKGQGRGQLEIKHPKLWWPTGMGQQPLYEVHVELLDAEGDTLDSTSKRIGLRDLEIVLPEGGNPLQFQVNGVPFFAKGGNWIPCDSFTSRVTPGILRRYVADAAAGNMNFLRFWGGGYYEDDALFDACDEMGICVWLDFKFACAAYPAFDEEFMDNIRFEARDNLLRLRHHPCIAVWCGNNEISLSWWEGPTWGPNRMSTAAYDEMFKDLIAGQVHQFAPQANYVSGSPDCGDIHYWEVWHGPKLFDAYRTVSGFMSEFGFQSFPEPKTVRAFTNKEDRASLVTPVMNWHQRDGSGHGNEIIRETTLRYFRSPRDFESALWLSQILQGYGIKIGAECWRQTMPKSMGCIFWQYNDIWPGMSWSSVDYFGRWKALHYLARKFYAPMLVSGLEHVQKGTVDVFITNDYLEAHYGKLIWCVTDLDGELLAQETLRVKIPARKSEKVRTLNLQEQIQKLGTNELLAWLKLEVGDKTISDNLVLLALPKELKLRDPELTTTVDELRDGFLVTLKSVKPALWAWLELENADARFSDNFVHVAPGSPQTILVQPKQSLNKDDCVKELRVRSLFDTYL